MANTIGAGNILDPANWSTNPSMPATTDDVVIKHNMTLNGSFHVSKLDFDAHTTITCTTGSSIIFSTMTASDTYAISSFVAHDANIKFSGTLTLTGNVVTAEPYGLDIDSGDTLTLNGNISGGMNDLIANFGTVYVNGQVDGTTANNSIYSEGGYTVIINSGDAIITSDDNYGRITIDNYGELQVTGNINTFVILGDNCIFTCDGNINSTKDYMDAIYCQGTYVTISVGNITCSGGFCLNLYSTDGIIEAGNLYGHPNGCLNMDGYNGLLTVEGNVDGGAHGSGIFSASPNTSAILINGNITASNGSAIYGNFSFLEITGSIIGPIDLISSQMLVNLPYTTSSIIGGNFGNNFIVNITPNAIVDESNVRAGTKYGCGLLHSGEDLANSSTGTLYVPAENEVRLGTKYDSLSKTGSLDLPNEADVALGVTYDQGSKTGTMTLYSPVKDCKSKCSVNNRYHWKYINGEWVHVDSKSVNKAFI